MIKKIINYIRHHVRVLITKREKRGNPRIKYGVLTKDRKNYDGFSEVTINVVRRQELVLFIKK